MPITPINYSKTIIYKIEHIENEDLVYVGHTTNFDKRKSEHKSSCKNGKSNVYNLKLYQMMRSNGGWDMFRMIEVEKYSCKDRREAEKRENEVMKVLKANMNMRNSFITEEEKKEHRKQYYEENKGRFNEQCRYNYKSDKEYRDKLLEKHRNYYEKTKDKKNEKIKCECGCETSKCHLKRHQATKKHIDLIKKKI